MTTFLYIDCELKSIEDKKFFCIYLLEQKTHTIFKVYKIYDEKIENAIKTLKIFQNVTERITYVIKREGKISLDIKL